MAKIIFSDVFQENADGTITPKRNVQIGAATIGSQITFGKGVSFGGINIFDFKDLPVEADDVGGVLVIKGFYKV